MIEGLAPYPNMRLTGLSWLPSIPAHWDLVPNRALMRRRKVLVGSRHSEYQLLSLTKQGVIVRDVESGKGKFSSDMGTSQEVRPGDLVFCLFDVKETPRTVGLSPHRGMITGAYTVYECRDPTEARYIEAYYKVMDDRKLLSPLYSGLRNTIPPTVLSGVKSPIPPVDEQLAILKFINHAAVHVRRYIGAKQRLIKLLAEQKQATVHRAVTKGLDPSVALKSSGVAWLGDIPRHWKAVPSKALFKHRREKVRSGDEMLTASQAHGIVSRAKFMAVEGRRVMQVITGDDILKHVEPNDFVMSMRSFQGGLEWSRVGGAISSAYVMLVPTEAVCPRYFAHALKSRFYISELRRTSDLVRDGQALRYANFGQVPLPLVPIAEQEAIADFLDSTTGQIAKATSQLEHEIALLREYLTWLVAEVVTGKLDVRGASAHLPDEAGEVPADEEPGIVTDEGASESKAATEEAA